MIKPKRFIYKNTSPPGPNNPEKIDELSQLIPPLPKLPNITIPGTNPSSPNDETASETSELTAGDIEDISVEIPIEIEQVQKDTNASALNTALLTSAEIPTVSPPALNKEKSQIIDNIPPEELEKKKKLIAKLFEKINQNDRFKTLIQYIISLLPYSSPQTSPHLNEKDFLYLSPIELHLLINTPPELFNATVLLDILQQKGNDFEDNINGKPLTVKFYNDRSRVLGKGGFGEVSVCLYTKWPENEEEMKTAQLKEGAIKVIINQVSDADLHATKNELATLEEIRKSNNSEGLLIPIHIGAKTLYDQKGNPTTEDLYSITEIIHPLEGIKDTYLSTASILSQNAENTIRFIKEACNGLSKIHKLGRVHWDLKPQNIFVGKSGSPDAPEKGKLGDLACPKILTDFLRTLYAFHKVFTQEEAEISPQIKKMSRLNIKGPNKGYYELTLPYIANPNSVESEKDDLIQLPVSLPYINRAYPHLQVFEQWAKTGDPENIHPEILALVDMGQMAETIERIKSILELSDSTDLFPSADIQTKAVEALTALIVRLDTIPKGIIQILSKINTIKNNLKNENQILFKKHLNKLQEQLEQLMTAEKLEAELEKIENMIKSNR